jgi:2-polyprenyl-3-methyl-5-hydroxy-6-metoxy-1,4-benzoquinol methylase
VDHGSSGGKTSAYFAGEGLDVTATDLSPAMIERVRAKGLRGLVRDVRELESPDGSFDAVYTCNLLLHVANAELTTVLAGSGRC